MFILIKNLNKIDIKGNEKKGKIIINYYSSDDLDRIYEMIDRM